MPAKPERPNPGAAASSLRLIESLATTAALAEVFSDRSILRVMLDFEAALARAQAAVQMVPQSAADAIARAARAEDLDAGTMAEAAMRAGTPAIPLVKQLTARVHSLDRAAAGYVHWGATSQDVCDTALVMLLGRARHILASDLTRLEQALVRLSERHSRTVMLGRTLMQPAPPVAFGLKAAGWLGAVHRSRLHLENAFEQALVLQFGGASGTLAALGDQGLTVAEALARELDLALPEAPWHAHRDRLGILICACGVLAGSLAKMARDIVLLAQAEVSEVAEGKSEGRGSSSAMPHKRNPVGSITALAAAGRVPALVSSFLSGMAQEHERAAGAWQAEWSIVAGVIGGTGLAAVSMAEVAEGLTVDSARMRANLEATRGAVFAERAAILLSPKLGRDAAHKLLKHATRQAAEQGRRLSEVLREMKEVTDALGPATLDNLEQPEQYLGSAEEFRRRLLAATAKKVGGKD
ncbi:MAG TPA: 3-carboxy-cis,cis-muconate cycloisomerase [Candidatus Angelobacter sp.]